MFWALWTTTRRRVCAVTGVCRQRHGLCGTVRNGLALSALTYLALRSGSSLCGRVCPPHSGLPRGASDSPRRGETAATDTSGGRRRDRGPAPARRRARAYAAVSGCRASAAYVARRPQSDRRGAQTLAVAEIAPSPPSLPPCRTRGLPYGHHTVRTHRGAARTEAQQGADKEPRPSGSRAYAEGAPTWRAGVSCYRCSYATYASNVSMPKSRGRSKSRSRRRVFISGPSSTLLPHAHRVC